MRYGRIDGVIVSRESAIHLYVAAGIGDDDDDGTTTGTALQTIAEAINRIPIVTQQEVIIHVRTPGGEGGYSFEGLPPRLLGHTILFYADDVWDPGVYAEYVSATPSAFGTGANVVVDAGFLTDELKNKTIEMVDGAAVGQRRTVRNNTATDIIPVAPFNPPPVAGDNYRIITPAITISIDPSPSDNGKVVSARGASTTRYQRDDRSGALVFVGFELHASDPERELALGVPLVMYGCMYDPLITTSVASVWCGMDAFVLATNTPQANIPVALLGVADENTWLGWGVYLPEFVNIIHAPYAYGYINGNVLEFLFGQAYLLGGDLKLLLGIGDVVLSLGPSPETTNLRVGPSGGGFTILLVDGAFATLSRVEANGLGTDSALRVLERAKARVHGNTTGESAAGYTVECHNGGYVTLYSPVNLGRAVGNDYDVGNGLPQNKSFFAAPGDSLINDNDTSAIVRVS